jgi:hypothetical protein
MKEGVMFAALVAGLVYSAALGMLGIVAIGGVLFAAHDFTPAIDDTVVGDYILQAAADADDGTVWPSSPFVS